MKKIISLAILLVLVGGGCTSPMKNTNTATIPTPNEEKPMAADSITPPENAAQEKDASASSGETTGSAEADLNAPDHLDDAQAELDLVG